jgi:hypothetical protein
MAPIMKITFFLDAMACSLVADICLASYELS